MAHLLFALQISADKLGPLQIVFPIQTIHGLNVLEVTSQRMRHNFVRSSYLVHIGLVLELERKELGRKNKQ